MEVNKIRQLQEYQNVWLAIFATLDALERGGVRYANEYVVKEIDRIDDELGPEHSLSARLMQGLAKKVKDKRNEGEHG